jgi:hypothetical protein
LVAPAARAASPCQPVSNPATAARDALKQDTDRIFSRLPHPETPVGAGGVTWGTAASQERTNEENLIVAGTRAGQFEIGSSWAQFQAKISVPARNRRTEDRYAFILPLGYVPERDFSDASAIRLGFAFSTGDGSLQEIFVRNQDYRTSEGIRVGSPASSLSRVSGLKRVHAKGTEYVQGNGITFVVDKGSITEIVVIRSARK